MDSNDEDDLARRRDQQIAETQVRRDAEDDDGGHVADDYRQASREERAVLTQGVKRFTTTTVILFIAAIASIGSIIASINSSFNSQDASDSARSAQTAAEAAQTAANAARDLAEAQRDQEDDATCRARFNAPIVDARNARDEALSRLLLDLVGQASASLTGDKLLAEDLASAVVNSDRLTKVGFVADNVNAQYQMLLAAGDNDRALFRRMCEAGPTVFPPPPPG